MTYSYIHKQIHILEKEGKIIIKDTGVIKLKDEATLK